LFLAAFALALFSRTGIPWLRLSLALVVPAAIVRWRFNRLCSAGIPRRGKPGYRAFLLDRGILPLLASILMLFRLAGGVAGSPGVPPVLAPGQLTAVARVARDNRIDYQGELVSELVAISLRDCRGAELSCRIPLRISGAPANLYRGQIIALPVQVEGRLLRVLGGEISPVAHAAKIGTYGRTRISELWQTAASFRAGILRRIASDLGSHRPAVANYVRAVLLGDRSYLGPGVTGLFRDAGLMHLFVMSGFHLGILYALVRRLVPGAIGPVLREGLAMAAVWLFIWLISPGASALRAALALSLHSVCRIGGWRPRRDSALALLFASMVAANPGWAMDAGLYLSFAAIWGLGSLTGPLELVLHRVNHFIPALSPTALRRLSALLTPSAAAQLAVMPLTLLFFGSISPQGVFATVLLVLPFYTSIALSSALLIAPLIHPLLSAPVEAALSVNIGLVEVLSMPFADLGSRLASLPVPVAGLSCAALWGAMAAFVLDCRVNGLLLSFSHVELRFSERDPRVPCPARFGHAEEIRPEFHDQPVDPPPDRLPHGRSRREKVLGNRSRTWSHNPSDG
jgi:ComEC/Rec2-related protein